jgi:DNA-binding MarR family transcriptional regulator
MIFQAYAQPKGEPRWSETTLKDHWRKLLFEERKTNIEREEEERQYSEKEVLIEMVLEKMDTREWETREIANRLDLSTFAAGKILNRMRGKGLVKRRALGKTNNCWTWKVR